MSDTSFTVFVWLVYAAISAGLFYWLWGWLKKFNDPAPRVHQRPIVSKPLRTDRKKSGLQSDILKEGAGPEAKNGDLLTVHYTAFLATGQKVDSSYDRGKTLTFKLGSGAVISGWDDALLGAKAGETRKITIPAKLAYGKKGSPSGKVPPNSTVIFDVQLLSIE